MKLGIIITLGNIAFASIIRNIILIMKSYKYVSMKLNAVWPDHLTRQLRDGLKAVAYKRAKSLKLHDYASNSRASPSL